MAAEKKDRKECDTCYWWGKPDVGDCDPCCMFPWFLPEEADNPPACNVEEFREMKYGAAAGENWTKGNVRDLKRLIVTTMEGVPYDKFSPEEIDSKADEYISAWNEKDSCGSECTGKCESCSKE